MSKGSCGECKKTSIGGQALIEGIMMRGPQKTVISCRRADGTIVSQDMPDDNKKKISVLSWPIIRGSVNFVQSMITGYKALMLSVDLSDSLREEPQQAATAVDEAIADAELYGADDPLVQDAMAAADKPSEPVIDDNNKKKEDRLTVIVTALSAVLGVVIAMLLMFVLPTGIFNLLNRHSGGTIEPLRALIEGIIKMGIFVGYVALVSMMSDIKRVFQYHGAEHKSIFCYEKGLPLTVENVREQSRFHPRCGTSFMILMLIVGVLFYSALVAIFPALNDNSALWIILKIIMLPVICGLGYELIKFCGRHDNRLTRIISAPGMWLQRLTTKEPDDSMIEVAIDALTRVIPEDRSVDKW